MDINPGEKYRLFLGEDSPHNKIIHIRAIVDEEYVVVKYWLRRGHRWWYKVEDTLWFETFANHLTKVS